MSRYSKPSKRRGLKSLLIEPYRQVQVGVVFLLLNVLFSTLVLFVFLLFLGRNSSSLFISIFLTPKE